MGVFGFYGDAGTGLDALNVSDKEYELVTGTTPWSGKNREPVRNVLEKIIWGTMDAAGYERFEVFAEYIAGIIALVVHPVNTKMACHFFSGKMVTLQQIIRPEQSGGQDQERVSGERLFGLVCAAGTDTQQIDIFKATFEKTALRKVYRGEIQNPADVANKATGKA